MKNTSYTRSLIIGTLLGATTALGIFIAHATTGEPGIPEEGLYASLLSKILVDGSPSTDGKVKNTDALGDIPATGYQGNINGTCPANQWAIGVDAANNITCTNW